jgi:hypothetical protein
MKQRLLILTVAACAWATPVFAADHARDRGPGVPTSMFGTYVEKGELLVYPFFEYYYDHDAEYSPLELGFDLDEDFRGKYTAAEGLIFACYGFTDDLALEFEAAVIDATLETAPEDPTDVPDEISESGLGDVQTQLNWRWSRETDNRPEFFSYFETVFPLQKDKLIIGTSDWEVKAGTGMVRGFGWGTMTVRVAMEYNKAEEKIELGELAVEYLRRLSETWRVYLGVEGTQDEIEFITEAQVHLSRHAFIKLNNAFGVTSKATDWAPEFGIMLSIPAMGMGQ